MAKRVRMDSSGMCYFPSMAPVSGPSTTRAITILLLEVGQWGSWLSEDLPGEGACLERLPEVV